MPLFQLIFKETMSCSQDLLDILYADLSVRPPFQTIEAGLSGGLDSVVLLHLLTRLRQSLPFELTAVHVHHGISPHADEWVRFCRRYCEHLGINLRIRRVEVNPKGLGWEAAARKERYRIFSDGTAEILALAHHLDDQIETFMLAALRGGGLKSLAAMPKWRSLNERTRLWRPLLQIEHRVLTAYAAQHGLTFVEDESNQNTKFRRNWLRREILPQLRGHVPHLSQHISAGIDALQQDLALLDEITADDYQTVCPNGYFLIDRWLKLSSLRQKRVLRCFFRQHQIPVTGPRALSDLGRVLSTAGKGSWHLGRHTLTAYRNRLFIHERDIEKKLPWCNGQSIHGRLKDILTRHGFVLRPHPYGLPLSVLDQEGAIRTAAAGDAISLPFGQKPVKKLLQDYHVLPPVRKFWPVIVNADDVCLAVTNLRANQDFLKPSGFLPVSVKFNSFIAELNPAEDVTE